MAGIKGLVLFLQNNNRGAQAPPFKESIMKDVFALIACVCGLVATLLGFAMNPLAYVFVGVAMVHLGIYFYLLWEE